MEFYKLSVFGRQLPNGHLPKSKKITMSRSENSWDKNWFISQNFLPAPFPVRMSLALLCHQIQPQVSQFRWDSTFLKILSSFEMFGYPTSHYLQIVFWVSIEGRKEPPRLTLTTCKNVCWNLTFNMYIHYSIGQWNHKNEGSL